MALHLLLGNLATNGVTNVHNEANFVVPSAFLPQRNLSLVKEQRSKDLKSCNKLGMDVLNFSQNQDEHRDNPHWIHPEHAGYNIPMHQHLCSDLRHHHGDKARANPRTIMTTISQLTLNQEWDDWIKACGTQVPHLHFHVFFFIDRIWALLDTGATKLSNINVVSGNRLIWGSEPHSP